MIETLLARAIAEHEGSARALAKAIGVSEPTVCTWLSRQQKPSLPSLLKLAKVTGDDPVEVCTAYIEKNRNGRAA